MLTVAKPSSGSLLFHLNHPRNLKNLKMVLVRRVSKDSLAHELGFRRTFDFSNQRGLEGVDVFLRVHRFILPHNQRESRSRRSGHRGRHHVKFRREIIRNSKREFEIRNLTSSSSSRSFKREGSIEEARCASSKSKEGFESEFDLWHPNCGCVLYRRWC